MIFKLKNNAEINLSLINVKDDEFMLLDGNDHCFLTLRYDGSSFQPENNECDLILDEEFYENLETLRRSITELGNTGIEFEAESSNTQDPFNPDEISIDTKTIAMETLLRRLEQGTIILNPDFQRQEVWDDTRKSQLIESLMLKIPIPMFYVSSDEKANWTVVDGLQRLSTFRDFILGRKYLENSKENITYKGDGLKLKCLEFWHDYEGFNFNSLPVHLYNRILETEFRFTIINPGTPEEVKRNIFKRLNTGGLPLSGQEIRNALYIGKATELLKKLSEMIEFKRATDNSIKASRMEDKELVLRFVAFLIRKPQVYNKNYNIDTWLSDTMIIINSFPNLNSREFNKSVQNGSIVRNDICVLTESEIKVAFASAMNRAREIFDVYAFRKSAPGQRRSPINKSLFETWGILLSQLNETEYQNLKRNQLLFMEEYKSVLTDDKFVIAISRDSMKHISVKYRFSKLKDLLNKYTSC